MITTDSIFENIIDQIKQFNLIMHGKSINEIISIPDMLIENIMSVENMYIFLVYDYIIKNSDKICNKIEIHDIMVEYAKNNAWILSDYRNYINDDNTSKMTIEEFVNEAFLNQNVDAERLISKSYSGNDGYDVPHASIYILNKIINYLKK